jgi:hypothetical protein
LLYIFRFHLSISSWLSSVSSWFSWGRNILLNCYLFFFNPFFGEINAFKAWDLMNVVAHSDYQRELIMLGNCIFDLVLCYLEREACDKLSTWRIMNQ